MWVLHILLYYFYSISITYTHLYIDVSKKVRSTGEHVKALLTKLSEDNHETDEVSYILLMDHVEELAFNVITHYELNHGRHESPIGFQDLFRPNAVHAVMRQFIDTCI